MPARRHQRLLDGAFVEPDYRCHIFEAIGAFVLPEVIGGAAAIGGEALGAGALGLGAEAAGIGGITAADFSLGLGEGLAGGLAGGGEAALGALTLGETVGGAAPTLLDALGFEAGGGGDALTGGALTPGGAAANVGTGAATDLATPIVTAPGGGSPIAAAPAVPTTAPLSPTGTGPIATTGTGSSGVAGGGLGSDAANLAATKGANAGLGPDFGGGGNLTGATGNNGSFLDRTLNSITGGAVGSGDLKDVGTVLSGGMMLNNLFGGDKKLPGEAQIKQNAASLQATAQGQAALGHQLEGFLQSGKLPPGVEQALRSATSSAQTAIKAQHASRGTSGSSAEAAEMQAASDRALEQGQKVALQLLQQGSTMVGQAVNTEGLASQLYQAIMADALEKDRELSSSVGNFAAALARSGGANSGNTITLKAA